MPHRSHRRSTFTGLLILSLLCVLTACATPKRAESPSTGIADQVRAAVGDSAEFSLIVTIDFAEPEPSDFGQVARRAEIRTHQEPGNIIYTFFASPDEPGRYVLFERWRSLPDLVDHLGKPYTTDLLEYVGEHDAKVSVRVLDPLF